MRTLFFSIMILGAQIGCDEQSFKASSSATGTVTLDGQPLARGTLSFLPMSGAGSSAFAVIESDGTFTVNTSAGTAGLEPGDYRVVVGYELEPIADAEGKLIVLINPIPAKYRDEDKSPLKVTVSPEGASDVKIELTSGE